MTELIRPSLTIHRRIEPLVSLWIETPRYLLKTVDQVSELNEVLKLRAQIFSSEYGVEIADGALDVDRYDFNCDHLVIIDRATHQVIGTYRLLCSRFTHEFYSQTEFKMDEFLASSKVKLELGRACIEPSHRKGSVLSLLWRGIIQYSLKTDATYLFGCSSVKTKNFAETRALHLNLISQDRSSDRWSIKPLPTFAIPDFHAIEPAEQTIAVPSLFQSYLNAGAKVYGDPAFDPAFHCMDFLTILNIEEIAGNYERRYQR
jgi:putative hemolysin